MRPCGGQSILICTLSSTIYRVFCTYSGVQCTIFIEGWMTLLDNIEYNADEDLRLHTEYHNPCCHVRLTGIIPHIHMSVLVRFCPTRLAYLTCPNHTQTISSFDIVSAQYRVHTILRTPCSYNINLLPIRAAYRCPIHRMITYGKLQSTIWN